MKTVEKKFICPKEAALSLGVSEGSVRRWLRGGLVRGAVKACGTWLLPVGFAERPGDYLETRA